jgi:hypothetical protein
MAFIAAKWFVSLIMAMPAISSISDHPITR